MWDEISEDENVDRTEGLDLIRQVQDDPRNIVFRSPEAELQGLVYYHSEYRWPAVIGANGTITVTVPRAGRFIPAVVVYDTSGRQVYELRVDSTPVGVFAALEDDNRQRLYFLREAIYFKGGEKLSVRVGQHPRHVTEDVLLLAERPPMRERSFTVSQVEAGHVQRAGQDQVRLTWTTTWPARHCH